MDTADTPLFGGQSVTSSLSRLYKPLHLDPDALEDLLRALPQAVGRAGAADIMRLNVSNRTAEGIHEHRESVPLEEVRRYPPTEHNLQLIYWYPGAPPVSVSMGPLFGALELDVSAGSPAEVQAVFTMLEERLGLERADEAGGLQAATDELTNSLRRVGASSQPLRCFLSYRFSDEDAALAAKVQKFLEAAGCEVLTGAPFRPGSLSEGIRDLITPDLDLAIVLIGPGGQSTWTRDEMTRAQSLGVPVVPLVASSQRFEPGIFGDTRWLTFDGDCVADTFTELLQALRYAREQRAARLSAEG